MKAILQRDFKDCGVTCLEYIIEFYHGYVPIETLREDTCTNQSGTTAYHLVETLKKYQFDSYGLKGNLADLEDIPLPAILHFLLPNGMAHFVVLTKMSEHHVSIMDPSYGKRNLLRKELSSIWDGVVLVAIPRSLIPRIPKPKSIFFHLFELLKKERLLVFKIVSLSIVISILTILSSLYIKIGMEYIAFIKWEQLKKIILIFATLLIFKIIFSFGKERLKIYLNEHIDALYLYSYLTHLLKLPIQKFESFQEGDFLTRIEEAKEIKDLFIHICINFLFESFLSLLSLFILIHLDTQLSLLLIGGMSIYVLISLLLSKCYYQRILKLIKNSQDFKELIMENLHFFPSMKHLNICKETMKDMEEKLCENISIEMQNKNQLFIFNFIRENLLELIFFLFLTYGIYLVGTNKLSIYDFLIFQSLYLYFASPLKELSDIGPEFYYMKGILNKMSESLELKEEEIMNQIPIPVPSIQISHLTYSYNEQKENIHDFSCKIKAKEHVFLEGPSGCGKSTLCKILHKEIEGYMGKITYEGKDLEDYTLSEIRSSVMYLSQREYIKPATIKENILLGSSEDSRFHKICHACQIEPIIENKPLRYDSFINHTMLSGGETQRIILARTLLKEGSIYLLDECLSEVEEKMEREIIKEIRKVLKGKTLIYISHKDHHELFERSISFENKKYSS